MCQAGCRASLFLPAAPFLREPQISFLPRIAPLWKGARRRLAHPTRLRSLFKSIPRAPRWTFPFQTRSHRATRSGYSAPSQTPGGFYTLTAARSRREESPTAALPPGGAHHARRARALPPPRELPRGRASSSAAPRPPQPRGSPAAPSRPPPEAAGSRCVTAGRGRDTGALPRIAPLPSSLPEPAAGGGASPEGAAGR